MLHIRVCRGLVVFADKFRVVKTDSKGKGFGITIVFRINDRCSFQESIVIGINQQWHTADESYKYLHSRLTAMKSPKLT